MLNICNELYTVSQKKHVTILLSISWPYMDRFLKFFHCHTLWKICNKVIINCLTTPELCRYTTLWNINVSKTNKLQSVRAHSDFSDTSESSDQDRSRWSVQHWIVLDLSLWIPGVLNDVCDWSSWLSTSLSTVVSGHVLISTRVLQSATPVPSVGAFCFPNLSQ